MLASEPHLEVRTRLPAAPRGSPRCCSFTAATATPGAGTRYRGSQRAVTRRALSLRGHGESAGADVLWVTGLDDYAADVERIAATLPVPPVLVGHSMGAAVVERLVATRPVRAAALLAPIPPAGLLPVAARLAAEHPDYLSQMSRLDPRKLSAEVLSALEPFYFSDRIDRRLLREAAKHLNAESTRAARPVAAPALAAARFRVAADVRAWRAWRSHLQAGGRGGHRAAPRRDGNAARGLHTC